MEPSSSNPLISSQHNSQLQAVLHPLVLLTISDYITRHTLRQQKGPILGALLGKQNGRELLIEHAFECHMREAPEVDGGYLLDGEKFAQRLDQMVTVHKDRQLEFVGWYTLMPSSGPTPTVLPINEQILQGWNESAVLLGFHPETVLDHSVGGRLPLTIYESNYEVDDSKVDHDGEDKKMDDGERTLKLKFREVPYSVETDETEMISMNYVASGSGNAAAVAAKEERPARSVETNGKGKRRLVESEADEKSEQAQDDDAVLTREEEETIAALTAKSNAIKMLHSRIKVISAYLERLPPAYISGEQLDASGQDTDHTTPSLTVLRQVQALVSRLDLVVPSDEEGFRNEVLEETNDVELVGLLNGVMQSLNHARETGRKFNIVETAKSYNRRMPTEPSGGGSGPPYAMSGTMSSAGDLLI